jgi:hypothetical protein
LATVRGRLEEEAALARDLCEEDYERCHRERVRRSLGPETAAELLQAVPPQLQWRGLHRYWTKREAQDKPDRS